MLKIDLVRLAKDGEELASRLQRNLCCYSTVNGDGQPCDCKYLLVENRREDRDGEQTGCCEARLLIELFKDMQAALRLADRAAEREHWGKE